MDFNSLKERTDKELFNIISNDEKWVKEIQGLAEEELLRRNYSKGTIISEKGRRMETISAFRRRQANSFKKNKVESYSFLEMIMIVILFPLTLFTGDIISEFSDLDLRNYKLKIIQRSVLIVISLIFYLLLIRQIFI